MKIDFSRLDIEVEKVIARHDAMFKFEMMVRNIAREELPFPANFALAAHQSAVIASEFNKKIKSLNNRISHELV